MSKKSGWIGVDFDGTLATYDGWVGPGELGAPVGPMVDRVKAWLSEGVEVRIFTARAYTDGSDERNAQCEIAKAAIYKWCRKHIGRVLPVTNIKDYDMIELWDDRAVQVVLNTGNVARDQITRQPV